MHHHHLLFGSSHDVRGEDELAKTLRTKKKQTVTKLIYSPAHKSSTFRKHCTAFDPMLQKNIQHNYKLIILVIAATVILLHFLNVLTKIISILYKLHLKQFNFTALI